MNIVLIGFMGSGKSAVGREVAHQLKMNYIDTDELIVRTEGLSIGEIFKTRGEEYFRELETGVIKTLQDYDNFVIATGGGMVLRPENAKMLKEIGPLVLLRADEKTIYKRIKGHTHRPLLKVADPETEIKNILDKREPVYKEVADHIVDTGKLDIEASAKEIIDYAKDQSRAGV